LSFYHSLHFTFAFGLYKGHYTYPMVAQFSTGILAHFSISIYKCDWKRKLFSTGYTVLSEMVATDRKENNVAIIPGKMAFHQKDAFYDKVDEYWSEDFWDSYNIIEPTESLENAVHKLKKQSR
ncbi:hypothetical protein L4X50_19930, partial [Phocaeicola vulgatus]|nr:hypothetical protein [Phocaeicola vulgatus]